MEAPRGVELTGTNGRKATRSSNHHGWDASLLLRIDTRRQYALAVATTIDEIASPIRFPSRHDTGQGVFPESHNRRFAAAMAQVRRPVPFRTRKLRPGTAMVLHPTGCGRVARRRTTLTGSPDTRKGIGASFVSGTDPGPNPHRHDTTGPARPHTGQGTITGP